MTPVTSSKRGFTVVADAAVSIAAAVVLRSSGEGYERVGGSFAADREARAILGQLASDLATARYHPDTMFQASNTSWPSDKLGFLSLQPGDAQS